MNERRDYDMRADMMRMSDDSENLQARPAMMQLLSLLLLIPSRDKWLIDILPPPLITVA